MNSPKTYLLIQKVIYLGHYLFTYFIAYWYFQSETESVNTMFWGKSHKHSIWIALKGHYTADTYLIKVNIGIKRAMCKICSMLTIKTPEGNH